MLNVLLSVLYLACSPLEHASIAQGIVPMSLSSTPFGLASAEPLLLIVNLVVQSLELYLPLSPCWLLNGLLFVVIAA